MKKKKLTRKERKQLLDEELAKRGVDPDARRHRQGSMASKMAWLSSFSSEEEASETFVQMLIMSHELADEPELKDLLFSPVQTVEVLSEVIQEMGLSGDLSDGKVSEDTQAQVRQKVTEKLLTKQLQQQFEKAVTRLAERLKRAHDIDKFISASAVKIFMETIKDPAAWATIGLIQEIVRRSLDAGFKILDFVDQQTSEEQSIGDVIRSLNDDDQTKEKIESVVKKIPGLRSYLEKEVDTVWDEGLKAIDSGELELELYSYEELLGGIEILLEALQPQIEEMRAQEDSYEPDLSDEQGTVLITRIEEYITGLFTPKRLEQLREHLNSCLQEPGNNRPYLAFISMVNLHIQADDAVEDEMALLMRTFFREMHNLEQVVLEEAADDE